MREIKFRAFDALHKRMFYNDFGDGTAEVQSVGVNTTIRNYIEDKNWVIMQFTGLRTHDGKDIYEGDWCRAEFRGKDGLQVIQGQIIMDDFMWCINCPKESGDDIYSINRPHRFEIIGNVYENPELL